MAQWSYNDGSAILARLQREVNERGGAAVRTADDVVAAVTGSRRVSRADREDAERLLVARGWRRVPSTETSPEEWVYREPSGRPTLDFLEKFRHRFERRNRVAPFSLRGFSILDDRDEGEQFFFARWGTWAMRAMGWQPAACPPDVHPLDVAWYPSPGGRAEFYPQADGLTLERALKIYDEAYEKALPSEAEEGIDHEQAHDKAHAEAVMALVRAARWGEK